MYKGPITMSHLGPGALTAKKMSKTALATLALKIYKIVIDATANSKNEMINLLQYHIDASQVLCIQCTEKDDTSCDLTRHKFSKDEMTLPTLPDPRSWESGFR